MIRLNRAEQGPRLFTAEEIRKLIDAAAIPPKAMLLLGINCGFGNADCASLPRSALDLEAGMIDFPRPKTGIPRLCPLWPETDAALREALAERPEPKKADHLGLVFITTYGLPWGKETSTNPVSQETAKLLKKLGINGRKGLGFYTLPGRPSPKPRSLSRQGRERSPHNGEHPSWISPGSLPNCGSGFRRCEIVGSPCGTGGKRETPRAAALGVCW